jgi:general secretion pathway protein B
MSFILDALKKSETERQRADTPALYEMKVAPARRGVAAWLIVLAALLVINVVVLSVVLLRGTHSAPPQFDANSTGTAVPAPTATAPPSAAPASAAPLPAAAPSGPMPSALPPDNAATGTAAPAADDDAPAVEPPATGAAVPDLPTYEQAASAPGADLPELRLDLHAYASNPADRFVLLNMLNLKEGQTSPAGVHVESITPDGAILSWRGTKFFLHSQ